MCGIAGFVNTLRKRLMQRERELVLEHMCRVIRHRRAPMIQGMLRDR